MAMTAPASFARPQIAVNTGYSREEYSVAPAGWNQWTQITAAGAASNWGILAGQSVVRRFGFTDRQATLGTSVKTGKSTGLEAKISVCADAQVLPRLSGDLTVYQGLGPGVSLSPAYRYSNYPTADVHMFVLGAEWEASAALTLLSRGYLTLTRFKGGGAEGLTPAVLAQAKLSPVSWLSIVPSYAYRRESFQSGAPGSFGSGEFTAHAGRMELRVSSKANRFAFAAWSYESRTPAALLRQYEFGLGLGF
ncbi:MAG: YaiO family outer membrane beta-barrel protein [Elusimicrobiota bacterium]